MNSITRAARAALLSAALLSVAVVSGAATAAAQDSGAGQRVDLELVLAVDASSSVSTDEFNLQIQGLAEAFRDPRVLQAIRASGDLGVAVSLFQWSDNRKQILAVDWTLVTDADQAVAFADEVSDTPRFLIGGSTAIGGALKFAIRLLVDNDYTGRNIKWFQNGIGA